MKQSQPMRQPGRLESAARFAVEAAAIAMVGVGLWDISHSVAMIVIGAIVVTLSLVGRLRA